MATRYVRAPVGAVNAGTSKGRTEIATFDDAKTRTVTGLWASDTTLLVHTKLDVAGSVYLDVEDNVFSKLNQLLDVQQSYPPDVKVSFDIQNDAAGNLVAGQVIVIRYEVT